MVLFQRKCKRFVFEDLQLNRTLKVTGENEYLISGAVGCGHMVQCRNSEYNDKFIVNQLSHFYII